MLDPSARRDAGMCGAGFPRFILLAPLVPFMLWAASPADAQPNAPLPSPSPAAAASAARHIGPAERDFLRQAANANRAEIEAGKLAQQRATDPAIKSYAQMLVAQHSSALQALQKLASGAELHRASPRPGAQLFPASSGCASPSTP